MKKQKVKEKNCSYKAWYFAELTVVWLQCDHTFTCMLYLKRKQVFTCSRLTTVLKSWAELRVTRDQLCGLTVKLITPGLETDSPYSGGVLLAEHVCSILTW